MKQNITVSLDKEMLRKGKVLRDNPGHLAEPDGGR